MASMALEQAATVVDEVVALRASGMDLDAPDVVAKLDQIEAHLLETEQELKRILAGLRSAREKREADNAI